MTELRQSSSGSSSGIILLLELEFHIGNQSNLLVHAHLYNKNFWDEMKLQF